MKRLAWITGGLIVVIAVPMLWSNFHRTRRVRLSSELLEAVQGKDPQTVAALLEAGADPKTRDASGATALLVAEAAGSPEVVTLLATRGADVNAVHPAGRAALHRAAGRGDLGVIEALLNQNADLEARDTKGCTPLMIAAQAGRVETVGALLDAGAAVDAADDKGRTALMLAASMGLRQTCGLLLTRGAQINTPDKAGCTALYHVLDGSAPRARFWPLETPENSAPPPDRIAAPAGKPAGPRPTERPSSASEVVAFLLARGADARVVDGSGRTVLDAAVTRLGHHWIGELRKRGVRASPSTDLLLASVRDDLPAARAALAAHADVNAADAQGRTPLHWGITHRDPQYVALLLQHGANPNAPPGDTLEQAVRTGNREIVEALLRRGARVNEALHAAVRLKSTELARTLLKGGADVNAKSSEGLTPLMAAASADRAAAMELLLDSGAEINAVASPKTPLTALGFAGIAANPECVELLFRRGAKLGPEDRRMVRSFLPQPGVAKSAWPAPMLTRINRLEKVVSVIEKYEPDAIAAARQR
jgi:ankyrin repeat protein